MKTLQSFAAVGNIARQNEQLWHDEPFEEKAQRKGPLSQINVKVTIY